MSEKFCQVCRGPWPDGHADDCPVKTGEPVQGSFYWQGLLNRQIENLQIQNQLMGMGLQWQQPEQ